MSDVVAIICGFDREPTTIVSCQRCAMPMLDTDVGYCPDCAEWLADYPKASGGRGKQRGARQARKELVP